MQGNSKKDLLTDISNIIDESNDNKEESYKLLKQWIKDLALADIDESDRIDLLRYGKPAFLKLKKLPDTDILKTFFAMVIKNRFLDATRLSKCMSYEYSEKREHVKQLVKSRDIYLLSPKLEMTMGGLGHTVRHRANLLSEMGYRITILNAGKLKNYDYILNHYRKTNQLEEDIGFYNYIKYFCDKNSTDAFNPTLDDIIPDDEDSTAKDDCLIKKIKNDDDSVTLEYYLKGSAVKSELFINKCLAYRDDGDKQSYYTPDGFKYYEVNRTDKTYALYERESGLTLTFKDKNQFLNHFLTEICLKDEKPYIICDSTKQWYNMNRIKLKDAFKIGALHGNPFIDFDPKKGLHPHVDHFKNVERYDRVVLLTKSVYDEVIEAGIDEKYLTVIPNFVLDEVLDYGDIEKDINKISIFSRIAPIKQMSHMIHAFDRICKENDKAYMEIYGEATEPIDKEELEALKDLAKNLNLEDRIHFKGYVEDVASVMKKTFFSLLTSIEEGFSMATIELMANSTPLISYDIRYGPSDLITNDVDGILIEKDDTEALYQSMRELLNDPEKTIKMGKAAKEKIRNNYSASAVTRMWEDLFIDIFIEDEIKDEIAKLNLEDDNKNLLKDNSTLKKENIILADENKKLKKEIEELEKFRDEVLSSKSWKITKPLRRK